MRTLLLVLLGAILGVVATAILTPYSGKKMRKKLQKQAKRAQLGFEARTEKSIGQFNEWRGSAEEMLEDAAKKMNGSPVSKIVID